MAKTKLEKHLEALGEETSGGAHDAVTFSGKGLGFLRDLFKGAKKSESAAEDDDMEDDLFDDEEDEEDGDEERDDDKEHDEDEDEDEKETRKSRRTKKSRRVKKSRSKKDDDYEANGGGLEDVDYEDDEDPGQEGEEEIITNHGRRVNARDAVRKSMREFEAQYEDVLDASDAVADLAKNINRLAKSQDQSTVELQKSIRVLAKGLEASLKAQASLAKDLELIKKQPVGSVSSGLVYMAKNGSSNKGRKLTKSEIADVVNDAMLDGLVDARTNSRLATINSQAELTEFVNALPAEVQERL